MGLIPQRGPLSIPPVSTAEARGVKRAGLARNRHAKTHNRLVTAFIGSRGGYKLSSRNMSVELKLVRTVFLLSQPKTVAKLTRTDLDNQNPANQRLNLVG